MNKSLIAIIALSATSFILLLSTVFFAVTYSMAERDFQDQIEVSRLIIQGFDSYTQFDISESEKYMQEAELMQREILDRNGLDTFQ